MIKSLVVAAVATVGVLGATGAQAGVSWSVNVNTPLVGTVVSGGPGYYAPRYAGYCDPGYYAYAPAPVYRVAPPVAYYPAPVYYRPVPVVVYPRYQGGWRHGHGRWHGHR
ncbi:MAG TPA: hypothetical protein VFA35_01270 [Burkholderiaceae bacterium]|nr:hypothetical protein [Burkholderiaceae bacterium]